MPASLMALHNGGAVPKETSAAKLLELSLATRYGKSLNKKPQIVEDLLKQEITQRLCASSHETL
jgi:Trp operon repressor